MTTHKQPMASNLPKTYKKLATLGIISSAFFLTACGADVAPEATVRTVPVNTQLVSTGHIATQVSFAGQVHPQDNLPVIGRIPGGMVDEVFFAVGDFVSAGDALFTMDLTDINNQIASLTAQLQTAEAAVRAAQTGVGMAAGGGGVQQQQIQAASGVNQAQTAVTNANIAIEQSEANVNQTRLGLTQAQNGYDTATQNLADSQTLFNAGAMSRVQLDQAENMAENARIGLEQATNGYNIATNALSQARVGLETAERALADAQSTYHIITQTMPSDNQAQAQGGLEQAQAQRNAIQVQLNVARNSLDDAIVRSPISGVVSARSVEPRTMLTGGAPFIIVSENAVTITTEVTQNVVNSIHPGDTVTVSIPAAFDNDTTAQGQVLSVSPATMGARTFTVEINVDNTQGLIRPGMFAQVYFTTQESANAVVIPRQAVLTQSNETVVYLVNNGQAYRQPVQTGLDNGITIEITAGITPGDEVIVTGQNFVNHGVALNIIEAS